MVQELVQKEEQLPRFGLDAYYMRGLAAATTVVRSSAF
jgi:hypothetical protein